MTWTPAKGRAFAAQAKKVKAKKAATGIRDLNGRRISRKDAHDEAVALPGRDGRWERWLRGDE